MRLNKTRLDIDLDNTIERVYSNDRYALFFIDWCLLDYDTRCKIISATVGEEELDAARNITTLAIVVPRVNNILNMSKAYLHISTFATVDSEYIKEFIAVSLNDNLDLYKDRIELEPCEIIELINSITPCKDMRRVI